MISMPKQALFVWIPKTAGQSILAALRAAGPTQAIADVQRQPLSEGYRFTTFHHYGIDALLRAGVITEQWLAAQYIFVFVRNPWDRLVSLYFYLKRAHPNTLARRSFAGFVRDIPDAPPVGPYNVRGLSQANPQTAWLTTRVNFIGRYENLESDWQCISHHLGIASALPHLNRSRHGPYRDYYTPTLRDKVAEFYADEIAWFGWEF